jgi:hypothetical protein
MKHRRYPGCGRKVARWISISSILAAAGANVAGAASPGDFEKAWAIEGLSTAQYYEVSLPDEAIAATRERWSDSAVFDARNRVLRFAVELDRARYAGAKETPGWVAAPCTVVDEPNAHAQALRCAAASPLARATGISFGVRSKNYHLALDLRLLDESGTVLSTYRADREGFLTQITIGFDAPVDGSAVIIEGLQPEQQLERAAMHALGDEEPGLEWRDARLVSGKAGDKVFVYATGGPLKAYSARISKEPTPGEFVQLHVGKCPVEACPYAEGVASLDATDFAKDGESYPVRLGTFGMPDPFLSLRSFSALAAVPRVRIGIQRPRLHFLANGTPPYAFAVGGKPPTGSKISRDLPMGPYAIATLAPYRKALPFWIIGDYAGPLLMLFALAIAGVWIARSRL